MENVIAHIRTNKLRVIALLTIAFLVLLAFYNSNNQENNTATPAYRQINQNSDMLRGDATAAVSFIQYSDFLCPSCSYVSNEVVPAIDKEYIATGQVQLEFRPMAFIAEGSTIAGMGAYCAVEQDKFWQYHDAVYLYVAGKIFNDGLDPKNDTILTSDIVKNIANDAKLAKNEFNSCLDSDRHLKSITDSTQQANRNGINGTPYLLIDGKPVNGNPNLELVRAMIKAAL